MLGSVWLQSPAGIELPKPTVQNPAVITAGGLCNKAGEGVVWAVFTSDAFTL